MLGNKQALVTIPVKDIDRAKQFYANTLGLAPAESREQGTAAFKNGSSEILMYESTFAGTNQATTTTWIVGSDVDRIARGLKAKGVAFEHYDFLEGMKLEGDVYSSDSMKVAWFKDPDGNIHALVSG